MGWIITGMEPSPTAVGPHVEIVTGMAAGVRETANLATRTIPFIVAPGIKTDAKVCQISVSTVETMEVSGTLADGDIRSVVRLSF